MNFYGIEGKLIDGGRADLVRLRPISTRQLELCFLYATIHVISAFDSITEKKEVVEQVHYFNGTVEHEILDAENVKDVKNLSVKFYAILQTLQEKRKILTIIK